VSTGMIRYASNESYERGNPETRYGETYVISNGLRVEQSTLTTVQESAEGILGLPAGEASEALQAERRREQIGRSGNRETEGPNG
jgi:hypothetical protein